MHWFAINCKAESVAAPLSAPAEPIPALRRKAERAAVVSSCCGFLGEVTLTDSAVVILFAGMLGAGDTLSMLTTSVLPLLNGCCLIPMAALVAAAGEKRVILTACILASASYFAAASAPWFGAWSVMVLITAILCFALSLTGFIAGWFPLLDTFLTRERRTGFFCNMRFCHQLTATLFLFAVGAAIGGQPSAGTLQGVLFLAAIIFTGRAAAIARIPDFRIPERGTAGFRTGLARAIGNKALTGFSTYLFVLNLAAFGTVPLMILCLKNQLGAPDNVIVFISGAALSGMLAGYLCAGKLLRLAGPRRFYPLFHALFFAVNFMLFFIGRGGAAACPVIAGLLFLYSLGIAAVSIAASAEMMALASPGNKVMAMALSGAFSCGGSGLSRFVTSLLLGGEMLAPEWMLGTMTVSRYQSLLLLYCCGLLFAAVFLALVPAVFPKGEYVYPGAV